MTARKRAYTSSAVAECHDCKWRSAGAGALGRGAQHHDKHRHRVTTTQTVTYDVDRRPTEGQEELERWQQQPETMF